MSWFPVLAWLLPALVSLQACKPPYGVRHHVLVAWEGNEYPAMIIAQEGLNRFKVHYDGYDSIWDEVVARDRIRGLIEGTATPPHPEPPAKVRQKAIAAAQTNVYKIGDRVR